MIRVLSTDLPIVQAYVRVSDGLALAWPIVSGCPSSLAPLSVRLVVVAAGFGLLALNVPVSLHVPGVYPTVTLHDFFGPRLVPVQPSAMIVNGPGAGETLIVSAAVAEPPE